MKFFKNNDIKVLSEYNNTFFEKKLLSFGYPINKSQHIYRTHVDWKSMKGFSFFYDYIGNDDITILLKRSKLCNPERKIILELNPGSPIIELSSILFSDNWEDIVNENSFGVSGISTDGELIFEFTDDSYYTLHSNFPIK
ncbi:hypothetical protein GO495_31490 [Chitinophaga oryziterrae]|uniref:Uncharacterized protein n=1 Tax=Chitinophaga oryziterrae TaxID=1031224 RepID=A0A6N8JJJ3_9BACT|nr:hypothetical protein [Chitinophaga oryziterrae]MVT45154.1 hypothetical protein [Chitinophaga oryziterrae]